jgi:hypothetical protein
MMKKQAKTAVAKIITQLPNLPTTKMLPTNKKLPVIQLRTG